MMFDFEMMQQLAAIVAFVLVAVGFVFLMPYLKERVGAEQLKNIWKWICVGVQAAEQIFGKGQGERKKQYALDFAEAKGLTKKVEPEELDALIEAAVRELT